MQNKSANRIEYDSLGEVFVPSNVLYGVQTQRAIENFPISGLKPRQAFIWFMGMIDIEKANAIIEAAQEVIDGSGTSNLLLIHFRRVREPAIT